MTTPMGTRTIFSLGRNRKIILQGLIALAIAGSILIVAGTALANGATSVETVDGEGTTGPLTAVTLDDNGNPTILYAGGAGVRLATCSDPNCSFPSIATVFTDFEGPADLLQIGFDSRGYPFLTYFVEFGQQKGRRLVRCNDQRCDSYTKEDVRFGNGLALAPDDRAIFTYQNSNYKVKVAQCVDIACTFTTLHTTIDDGEAPVLAIDDSGYPAVAYRSRSNEPKLARCNDLACSAPTIQSIDMPHNWRPSKILLDENDHPVISFTSSDGLGVAQCKDPLCQTASLRVIDPARVEASLTLDENGHAVLAYRKSNTIRLARCHDQDCANLTVEVVDESRGRPPSLVLDSDGFAVIAYNDDDNDSLKLARCGNTSCLEFDGELPEVGTYYLRSLATGRYLDADANGAVGTSHVPKRDDEWNFDIAITGTSQPFSLINVEYPTSLDRTPWIPEDAGDGTFYLRRISDSTRNYLSTSGTGVVMTIRDRSDQWEFVPVAEVEPTDLVGEHVALQNLSTNRWLDFDGDGSVGQSVNQGADDVWQVEDAGDDFVYLRSDISGRYLTAGDDFTITTIAEPDSKSKWEPVAADGIATFRNTRFGGFLAVQGAGDEDVVRVRTSDFSSAARWQFVIIAE